MSLTVGTGPFGPYNSGAFNFDPGVLKEHTLYLQESPKRVRAMFNGETVVDSQRAKLPARDKAPARLLLPRGGCTRRPARRKRAHHPLPVQGRRLLPLHKSR